MRLRREDALSFDSNFCKELTHTVIAGTDIPIFYVIVAVPTVLFLLFLLLHLRGSIRKLRESDSMIMSTCYGFIWGVLVFNIVRIIVAVTFPSWSPSVWLYNLAFLIINFILMFIEVSVLVFMSENYTISGREGLPKAVWFAVFVAVIYAGVQAIIIFVFDVSLYRGLSQSAHIYWFVLESTISGFYLLVILLGTLLPCLGTRKGEGGAGDTCFAGMSYIWRIVNFPEFKSRPQFYYYVGFLFFFNAIRALGNLFAYVGIDAGHCLDAFGGFSYYCLYVPLLYWAFLRGFFKEPTVSEHYSEMMLSGYFDSDT